MKTLGSALAAAAALLVMASCTTPTNNSGPAETPTSSVSLALTADQNLVKPASFLTADSKVVLAAGWQNAATGYTALTVAAAGAQSYRSMNYGLNGTGTTAWVDDPGSLYPATNELQANLKLLFNDQSNGGSVDSHVLINFEGLDLSSIADYDGVTFAIRVPKASEADYVRNTGFSVLVRQRTEASENTAVYVANLGSGDNGAGTIGSNDGNGNDWIWWGDSNLFVFKVPFDFFVVPGWLGGASNEPGSATTIADALAAGAEFNSIDLDFRFNADGSGYSDEVDYPAYVSSVGFY